MKLLISKDAYIFALYFNLGYNFKINSAHDTKKKTHMQKLNIII